MNKKQIPRRTHYRPPQKGMIPDPIREALYGKAPQEPPVEIAPPPELPVISRPSKRR